MWKCPKCGREFSRQDQSHYCDKPKTIDEYINTQGLNYGWNAVEIELERALIDADDGQKIQGQARLNALEAKVYRSARNASSGRPPR